MLAAGTGSRLERGANPPPKVMLGFAGKSLLQRHVEILRHLGVDELVMVTGYRAESIHQGIHEAGAEGFVRTIHNPDFIRGTLLSLWTARRELMTGDDIIYMDADVLYDHRLMAALLDSAHGNCLLMDRNHEPGEDPVKICIRDGAIVDFHKVPREKHDHWGEWPGFLRLTPECSRRLVTAMSHYVDSGRLDEMVEEAIRDVVLSASMNDFGVEDVTGLPWIEIDFPEDLVRARREVLPALVPLDASRARTG